MNFARLQNHLVNMTSIIHPLNWHCYHICAQNAKPIHAVPSGAHAAMLLADRPALHAREVESTHSHAEDAMGLGKAEQSGTAQVATELDEKRWVNAELVKGLVALHVWPVTCTLRLEVQGLFVGVAPAKLRMP